MRTYPLRPNLLLALNCLLVILLFFLGSNVPGARLWGSYLLPIVLAFLWGSHYTWRRDIYIVTALASLLIVLTFWTGSITTGSDILTNHLLPILILWAAAWLLAQRRKKQEDLDAQVTARTAALGASEVQLAKLFRANPGAIAITRQSDGCYLDANPAYLQQLGFTKDELVGRRDVDLGILSAAARAEIVDRFKRGDAAVPFAVPLHTKTGATIDVMTAIDTIDFEGESCYLSFMVDITPRKPLEARASRLAALVDAAQDAIMSADLDGTIVTLNRSAEALYGTSAGAVVGQNMVRLTPPDYVAPLQEMLGRISEGEATTLDDVAWTLPVGSTRSLSIALSPIWDGIGHVTGFASVARDITERKAAERALRESEARFAKLFGSSPVGITLSRLGDGRYLEVNDAFLAMVGYGREELVGHTSLELGVINPEDRQHLMTELLQHGSVHGVDLVIHAKGGEQRHTLYAIEPLEIAGQSCVLSSVVDVTERRRLEAALRSSEARYRLLVDNAEDVIWTVDLEGRFTFVNPAVEHQLGYRPEEVIGQRFDRWLTPAAAAAAMERLAAAAVQVRAGLRPEIPQFEGEQIRKDGTLIFTHTVSVPLLDEGGRPLGFLGITRDVSERKQLEDRLRDSEARFRLIVQNSPDVIALYNEQGTLTYISPTVEATHGATAEQALAVDSLLVEAILTPPGEGPRADELARVRAHPQFAERRKTAEIVAHCLEHPGLQQRVELSNTLLSGEVRDFDSAFLAHLCIDGSRQVVSITRDITARKRLEAELQALVERWNMAAEISSIGFWDWRIGSDEVIWDERMYRLHGLAPGSAVTFATWRSLIHPDDRAAVEASSRKCGLERTRVSVEYRVVLPDGSLRHLLSIGGGLYDGSGTPVRQLGISMDITERKQMEEALAISEAQLREALQRVQLAAGAAGIGIWTWNFGDSSLEWDECMCEMHAVTPEEQGRISYDLWRARIHPDDLELVASAQGDPSRAREQPSTVYRIVLPGGAVRHIQAKAQMEYARNGQPLRIIGINRDITDQVMYDQLLQDTNEVLERRVAERTAELQSALTNLRRANQLKDEFMAMISHELRTPLTGVLTLSELLAAGIGGPLTARQATYVQGITESGERLLVVINGILSYTHLLAGNVRLEAQPCDLTYLLDTFAASQQHKAAEKHQSIGVRVVPPDLAITTDATALAEVLKRLLDNAVKFTPDGGQIGLEAHPGVASDTVDLVVWDTGIGIAADQLDRVFRAFTQVDARLSRSYEGIGMGLAYVNEMVRLLGGTIALESKPAEGSRFTITLPGHLREHTQP